MFYIFANGKQIYQPLVDSLSLINPRLVVEMGKAGSLEFDIPPSNTYYAHMDQLRTIVTVEMDNEEIFRGRVLSNERNFNNIRRVYNEGDLAYLVDSVQKAEKYEGSAHTLFRQIISKHNARVGADKRFTVGEITVTDRDVLIAGQSDDIYEDAETSQFDYKQIALNSITDDWVTTFDYIETCLINYIGGYLRTRRVGTTTYIDWLQDYGNTAIQEIELGKNMIDMDEEISAEDLFTVLIPLGDENLTIESVNGGSDELVDSQAVALYGRIVRTHVFSGVTSAATLMENAQRYLASNVNLPVTITVKAIDMHLIDSNISAIHVGDRVHISSSVHGLVEYLTCTRIEYDLSNPANNTYTFGNPKQTLTERYRKDKKAQQQSTRDAASSSGGGSGSAADEKAKEEQEDFFDAWINVDPESAHIDLGTLYKNFEQGKLVLQNQCGIDMDGVSGNINIKSLKTSYDETEQEVAKQAARISLLQEDTGSKIELVTAYYDELNEKEEGHYAEFTIFANETTSEIGLKADKVTVDAIQAALTATKETVDNTNNVLTKQVGIYLDGSSGNVNIRSLHSTVNEQGEQIAANSAAINQSTTALSSRIDAVVSTATANGNNIASLQLIADQHGSSITANADKININAQELNIHAGKITGVETRVSTLETEYASIEDLIANKIQASWQNVTTLIAKDILISGSLQINDVAVSNNNHSHFLTENDGYITLGYATSEKQSFRIADTNAYKEGVSAAVDAIIVDFLDRNPDTDTPDYYDPETHNTTVLLKATASNGKYKTGSITVSGSQAFIDGQGAGSAAGFIDGVNSVTVDTVGRNPDTDTPDYYNSSTHNTTVSLKAMASNGKYKTGSITVSGASAYSAGVTDGVNSVAKASYVTISVDLNDRGDGYDISATVYDTNNQSMGITAYKSSGSTAYSNGVNNGRVGYTKGTFSAVSVTPIGESVYRYTSGGSTSGTKQGNAYSGTLYYKTGSGYYKLGSTLYRAGSSYSYNLLGSGGWYYTAGSSKTYYVKS